jgi:hypothetical protein
MQQNPLKRVATRSTTYIRACDVETRCHFIIVGRCCELLRCELWVGLCSLAAGASDSDI